MRNKIKKNFKVLLFTASFPPPFIGGSVEYVFNIASNMPPGSLVIHTANIDPYSAMKLDNEFPHKIIRSTFVNHVLKKQIENVALRKLITLREYILWPLTGLIHIIKERPHIVHIGEHNFAAVSAWIASRIFGIPYVYYTYAEEITILSKRKFHNKIFLSILKKAEVIISVSNYTRRLLTDSGIDAEKIKIVLPSVSERKLIDVPIEAAVEIKQKYSLLNEKILLTVGSLEKRKGHTSVIKALGKIRDIYPNIKYIVVGGGPEENNLKCLVEQMGLVSHVVFTGRINDTELNGLYEICDIFVMPHRQIKDSLDTEGCPTVFLEASAHGKVVIGGNAGGVSDAIIDGETGYIIEGTDEELLSNNVLNLLGNPKLAERMGKAGQKYVSTLTPQMNAEKVLNIYYEIINKNRKKDKK